MNKNLFYTGLGIQGIQILCYMGYLLYVNGFAVESVVTWMVIGSLNLASVVMIVWSIIQK